MRQTDKWNQTLAGFRSDQQQKIDCPMRMIDSWREDLSNENKINQANYLQNGSHLSYVNAFSFQQLG